MSVVEIVNLVYSKKVINYALHMYIRFEYLFELTLDFPVLLYCTATNSFLFSLFHCLIFL